LAADFEKGGLLLVGGMLYKQPTVVFWVLSVLANNLCWAHMSLT
jgi:hypothetical protein